VSVSDSNGIRMIIRACTCASILLAENSSESSW